MRSKRFEATFIISKHVCCGDRTIDTGVDSVRCMNDIVNNAEWRGGNTIIRIRMDFNARELIVRKDILHRGLRS